MKTKTLIENITHDDLVNLFSTAMYGSYIWSAEYNKTEYKNSDPNVEEDCFEDKLARVLLHGYSITIIDCYAEDKDEHYGNLPYHWNEENEVMEYTVTLKDIANGIEKAIDNKEDYSSQCANNLINNSFDFDLPQAEELLQWIIFGESIYG